MPRLLTVLLLTLQHIAFAQGSDFISVRKWSGRALKTFYAGSPIHFQTKSGTSVQGVVRAIRNDSVFVYLYDVRRFQTYLGVPMIDTVATYTAGWPYTAIKAVLISKRVRPGLMQLGRIMMYGGGGYMALNVVNGGLLNESVGGKENMQKLSIAAGVFLAGFIVKKHFKANQFGRRQRIVYIRLR